LRYENAVALFQKIYAECGAEAVEHICKEVLEAIRAEREEKQADRQPRRKSGPHENTKQLPRDWDEIYPRELRYRRAGLETLAKWIAELKKSERTGKTKSGKRLSALELKQIRDYRARLEEKHAAVKSKKSKIPKISAIRKNVAEGFVRARTYGRPRGNQDDVTFINAKLKRARRSIRGKRRKPARK
jgi:hypothetical protein